MGSGKWDWRVGADGADGADGGVRDGEGTDPEGGANGANRADLGGGWGDLGRMVHGVGGS